MESCTEGTERFHIDAVADEDQVDVLIRQGRLPHHGVECYQHVIDTFLKSRTRGTDEHGRTGGDAKFPPDFGALVCYDVRARCRMHPIEDGYDFVPGSTRDVVMLVGDKPGDT